MRRSLPHRRRQGVPVSPSPQLLSRGLLPRTAGGRLAEALAGGRRCPLLGSSLQLRPEKLVHTLRLDVSEG